eukprot:371708-Rhodomonas_salina.1
MALRARYAMAGTERGYAARGRGGEALRGGSRKGPDCSRYNPLRYSLYSLSTETQLPTGYAMSGNDRAYAATRKRGGRRGHWGRERGFA